MSEVLYEGKSKLVLSGPDADSVVIRYKDTATAFNGEKKAELSGKGALNAAISHAIYKYLEKNGVKTHLIKVLDDSSALVKKAEIIMVEVIIRNVAAGGFSQKYGVKEGSALGNTVLEFCYKSDELGDPMMNESQITAISLATLAELKEMGAQAFTVNELLSGLFAQAGIKLVDFKLEFGRYKGEILLCDEISPDSCRLWDIRTGEKLDKDRFRRDLGDVLEGYRDVLSRLEELGDK
jgi:phosphoribosylaminoimidazole-succinocarboxamide synthase